MESPQKNKILTCFLLLFFLFSPSLLAHDNHAVPETKLKIYDGIGGDFTLNSTLSKKVSLEDYHGKVVLLNFGYTSCPDVCPLVLANLKNITESLEPKQKEQLQVLFVTLDPEIDTATHLKEYLSNFDPNFVGLTGSKEDIVGVSFQYAAPFYEQKGDKLTKEEKEKKLISHADYIYLIDQIGQVRELYRSEVKKENILKDINQFIPPTPWYTEVKETVLSWL